MIRYVITCAVLAIASAVHAAVVTLPNEGQSTTFTADVTEQASIVLPASITFEVTDVSKPTSSTPQTVSVTNAVLLEGRKLRIEIRADGDMFQTPPGTTESYVCEGVSLSGTWTNGTGYDTNLDITITADGYNKVAEMTNANSTSLSTNNLVFTLGANPYIQRAGEYTLSATWRVTSF